MVAAARDDDAPTVHVDGPIERVAPHATSAALPASVETVARLGAAPSDEPATRAAARAPGTGTRVRGELVRPATAAQVVAAKGIAVLPGREDTEGAEGRTPTLAIAMIVGAVACFALLDTAVKWLVTAGTGGPSPDGMSSVFVVWARYVTHAVALAAIAALGLFGVTEGRSAGERVRSLLAVRSWPWQIARAGCMFAATLFNFIALQWLQLAQTVAIFFVAPLVVTALAGPMLGEWVGWRRWSAIVVGFTGVVVMARPGSELFQPALVFSILSMLGYSIYVLLTRKLAATEGAASLVFVSAILPALALTPALPWAWTLPGNAVEWTLTPLLGLVGLTGHFLLVRAYGRATTGALAPFTYAQIAFMVLLGWAVFGNLPDAVTWTGIAIIAAAGLYVLARERAGRSA